MRNGKRTPYVAMVLTAFCVVAASLLVVFLLFNARGAARLVQSVALILRPIFMGAMLAFLLLPVHHFFLRMMLSITPESWMCRRRMAGIPNFAVVALSLITAFLTLYVLLVLVVPQVWQSVVHLVRAIPFYTEQAQAGLWTIFDDKPDLIMRGIINGKLLDSLIVGVICLVCRNLFRFPHPARISAIIGGTNKIPFFWPLIGAIPCIVLIFLIDPLQSEYFALFVLVLQRFNGNIPGSCLVPGAVLHDSVWRPVRIG